MEDVIKKILERRLKYENKTFIADLTTEITEAVLEHLGYKVKKNVKTKD